MVPPTSAPPTIPIGQAIANALELFEPVAAAVPHAAAPLNAAPTAAPIIIPSRLAGDIAQPEVSDSAATAIRPNPGIFRTLSLSEPLPPN
jgi:hypothetical protein